jgi:quinol monooxygenase YgiN
MASHVTATYQVKPAAIARVKQAIAEFVAYVTANEPGTWLYSAWQEKDRPAHFQHFFIFQDAAAQAAHGASAAVKRFQAVYRPELVGGDVVFTTFESIASNRD